MSSLKIPVLTGYRQSSISLYSSSPVRAWLGEPDAHGDATAIVPHPDLIRAVIQEPLLHLTFLPNVAVLSQVNSNLMVALPVVFLEGVGLKCYDLRGSGLPLHEVGPLTAAA